MPKRERETNQQAASEAGDDHGCHDDSTFVTLLVMKGTVATSVKVDPSKYGFLSTQLQDEAYAQQYVNTDEVIADLSEGAMGPELAADIATTLDVADGRITVTSVRLAAQTLRGADYLQLREELYLEEVAEVLFDVMESSTLDPDTQSVVETKEVVPCVHTGQLMWDRLGAYTVLRLEQKGVISLGHKGIIDAKNTQITDELLALATVLNDVTSLKISDNYTITTCEPFADTLVELDAYWCDNLTDDGLKLCTKIRKLDFSCVSGVTSCAPFADTLEELKADGDGCGITDDSLRGCRKLRKLSISHTDHVTTCAPFADTLEELEAGGKNCVMTDDGLRDCTKLRKLDAAENQKITTCEPFLATLEHLETSSGFTTASLNQVAEKCPRLRHLDLFSSSRIVVDEMIQKVASNCRQLEYVKLWMCAAVTDAAIMAVAENCTQLQELHVDNIASITDASIIKLAENCPQLTVLGLVGSSDLIRGYTITDAAIAAIAKNCNKLEFLRVSTHGTITDESILELAKYCPRLSFLGIGQAQNQGNITNESLEHLPSSCDHFLMDLF